MATRNDKCKAVGGGELTEKARRVFLINLSLIEERRPADLGSTVALSYSDPRSMVSRRSFVTTDLVIMAD